MKTMTDELRDNRTCSAVCMLVNAMRKTCLQHCWWLHAINSSPRRSCETLWQGRFVPWNQQVDSNVQWIQYGNSWKVDQWVPKLSNTGDWPGLVQTPKFRCLLRPPVRKIKTDLVDFEGTGWQKNDYSLLWTSSLCDIDGYVEKLVTWDNDTGHLRKHNQRILILCLPLPVAVWICVDNVLFLINFYFPNRFC